MLTIEKRNELIIDHMLLANQIAAIQFSKTPPCVQLDELKSAAYMGLVDAAIKYDETKPFKFYASFRIYGEIKDYLRGLRWTGRKQDIKVYSLDEYDYAIDTEVDDFNELFESLTNDLSPIGKKILWLYYAEDKTMQQIGNIVHLSVTRIYQILQASIEKIRSKQLDR